MQLGIMLVQNIGRHRFSSKLHEFLNTWELARCLVLDVLSSIEIALNPNRELLVITMHATTTLSILKYFQKLFKTEVIKMIKTSKFAATKNSFTYYSKHFSLIFRLAKNIYLYDMHFCILFHILSYIFEVPFSVLKNS